MAKPLNMQQTIVTAIKQAVASGVYKEGGKLPSEPELGQQFKVSRTVVREAISMLKAEGYVRTKRGRYGGYEVMTPGFEIVIARLMDLLMAGDITVRQAAEMRLRMEMAAVRDGIENVKHETVVRLYEIDAAMRNSKEVTEHSKLNADFHSCIGSISGNKLQGIFLDLLLRFVGRAVDIVSSDYHQLHSTHEHLPIIKSIENNQVEQACHYLEKHILNAVDRLEMAERQQMTRRIHASLAQME